MSAMNLPLRVTDNPLNELCYIVDSRDTTIAEHVSVDHAAEIVRAVNAHAALVAALKLIESDARWRGADSAQCQLGGIRSRATEALAKAQP